MQCACAILSSVACLTLHDSSTLSHNGKIFGKKGLLKIQRVLWFSLRLFFQTFLILRRTGGHMIKNVHRFQINQTTRCNSFTSLLLDVYVRLNMFRALPCPSSGAYNCISSHWFYGWSVAVAALLVVVWRARPRPTTLLHTHYLTSAHFAKIFCCLWVHHKWHICNYNV